ncbi:hypothetical protein BJ875DRAFT_127454 [Amylocarpus encephaloides]|uniref:Uncharacterized protein n=1 Tax=Amylocarpus encephaloides TaxID=45428 RepID=A0A9P7YCN5_9HELO|nr:hypothetical protein BJ875DRAFT_127454 [Amylocarpus encephaloides]
MIEIIPKTHRVASDVLLPASPQRSSPWSSSSLHRRSPSEHHRSLMFEHASWPQAFLPQGQLTSHTHRGDLGSPPSCHKTGSSVTEKDHTDSSSILLTPSSSKQTEAAIDEPHGIVDRETSPPLLPLQHYLFTCEDSVRLASYCYPRKIADADLYDDHRGEIEHPPSSMPPPSPRSGQRTSTHGNEPTSTPPSWTHTLQDHPRQLQTPFQRWLLSTNGSEITPAEFSLQKAGRHARESHSRSSSVFDANFLV